MDNEIKKNDWLAANLANSSYSIDDFRDNGVNIDNTSLGSKDVYERNAKIQAMPMFQTHGIFDKSKFEKYYDHVASTYNELADTQYHDDVMQYAMFHRDNIFVPEYLTRKGPDTSIAKVSNPMQQVIGLYSPNEIEEPTQTRMEIAETQKSYDPATDTWHDAPNDAFWSTVANPMALAQWDSDGDAIDPFTGEKTHHVKGELKTNAEGYNYFEYLNGSSPVGRQVLKDTDILTRDGSWWNHYDFMDCDDKKKSTIGTIVKDALPIALFAIPYVNTAYISASLIKDALGIGAAIGKCFLGSDNSTLNTIDSFTQSLGTSTSEYSQTHPWSIENILNMASDTYQMIYEQRYLFKQAPKLFGMKDLNGIIPTEEEIKNGAVLSDEAIAQKAFVDAKTQEYKAEILNRLETKGIKLSAEEVGLVDISAESKAARDLNKYIEDYNNIGKQFSQAYMTLAPVAGVYDSLKQEGASDPEASMMTLGVAAANGWLMSLPIGSWVLPELRMDRVKMKNVIRTFWNGAVSDDLKADLTEGVAKAGAEASQVVSKEAKNKYLGKLFDKGKSIGNWLGKIYKAEFSPEEGAVSLTAKAAISNSVGMGLLGVSFDVLLDLSKSITNTVRWFNGSNETPLPAFDNIAERYAKDMLGGFIGGGLMQFASDFRTARDLVSNKKNLSFDAARQEIVALIRNGQKETIEKVLDKMPVGDFRLSPEAGMTEDGKLYFKEGTSDNNHDIIVKKIFKKQLDSIDDILTTANANKPDSEILDIQTLKDLRFAKLQKSTVASALIRDFNSVVSRLTALRQQADAIAHPTIEEKIEEGKSDVKEKTELKGAPNIDEDKLKVVNTLIKEYQARLDDYNTGKNAKDFISAAVFEASGGVLSALGIPPTFEDYVSRVEKKDISTIPQNRLSELRGEYEDYKFRAGVDSIIAGSGLYRELAENTSPILNEYVEGYKKFKTLVPILSGISDWISNTLNLKGIENLTSEKAALAFKEVKGTTLRNIMANTMSHSERSDNFLDDLKSFVNTTLEPFIDAASVIGIDPTVKKTIIKELAKYADEGVFEDEGEYDKVSNLLQKLKEVKSNPMIALLDRVALSSSNLKVRASNLLNKLDEMFSAQENRPDSFMLDDSTVADMKQLDLLTNTMIALVRGSVTDIGPEDLYALNTTLNELYGGKFTEMSQENALTMLKQLESIKTLLTFYKTVDDINNGRKLNTTIRVGIQKNVTLYEKYSKLLPFIPPTWKDSDKLKNAIEEAKKLSDALEVRKKGGNIVDLDQKEIYKEIIKIDDAFHDFINSNLDKDFSEFINSKNFYFYEGSDRTMTDKEAYVDDVSFVWYLASCAVLTDSEFLYKFKNALVDGVAPIDIQEMAVKYIYSFALNRKMFDRFTDAVIKSMKSDAEAHKGEEGPNSLVWERVLDSRYAPIFKNCLFIEGIAGSGKTSAVFKMALTMLQKHCKGILNNVGLCSTNTEALGKALGSVEGATSFVPSKLMTRISPDWSEKMVNGRLVVDVNTLNVTDEYGLTHTKWKVRDETKPLSLIMIDEISRFSNIDLDLINRYAERYGTIVIVAGDLDQIRNVGSSTEELTLSDGSKFKYKSELSRGNFIRCPKMGVSLRVNNIQKAYNTGLLQSLIAGISSKLVNKDGPEVHNSEIIFKYYEDSTHLNGDKVYQAISLEKENPEFDNDVQKLINSLGDKEVLGYIASTAESAIFKKLSQKYGDKIKMFPYGSVQGSEAAHYIIEVDDNGGCTADNLILAQPKLEELYTYITRAQEGSIIITKNGMISSMKENATKEVKMDEEDIRNFSKLKKDLLDSLFSSDYKVPNTPFSSPIKKTTPANNSDIQGQNKEGGTSDVPDTETGSGEGGTGSEDIRKSSNSTKDVVVVPLETTTEVTVDESRDPEDHTLDPKGPINEEVPGVQTTLPVGGITVNTNIANQEVIRKNLDKLNQVADVKEDTDLEPIIKALNSYSFTVFESGWVRQPDGTLAPSGTSKARIDSFNGISKLNSNLSESEMYDLLAHLETIILTEPDKIVMLEKIKSILHDYDINIGDDLFGTYAFKTYNETSDPKDPNYDIFVKGRDEKLDYEHSDINDTEAARAKDVARKNFVFIIGEGKENKLEVPIFQLPNVDTVIRGLNGTPIRKDWVVSGSPNLGTKAGEVWLQNYIRNHPDDVDGRILGKLYAVYNIRLGQIYYIKKSAVDKGPFTVAKDLKVKGMVIDFTPKGTFYKQSGFLYRGQWHSIAEMASDPRFEVSDIMMSPTGEFGGSVFTQSGKPFILCGPRGLGRDNLLSIFKDQLTGKVSTKLVRLYPIEAPSVPIKDYIDNLLNVITGKTSSIKNIGNVLTSLHICKILLGITDDFVSTAKTEEEIRLGLVDKRSDLINNFALDEETVELLDAITPKIVAALHRARADGKYNRTFLTADAQENITVGEVTNSLKYFMQKFIAYTVYDRTIAPDNHLYDFSINENKLKTFEDILAGSNFDRVYYTMRYMQGERNGSFAAVAVDSNNRYSINGIPFMIDGKPEGLRVLGNLEPILDEILKKSMTAKFNNSIDNKSYKEGSSRIDKVNTSVPKQPDVSVLDAFLDKGNKKVFMDNAVRDSLSEYFKGVDKLTITNDMIIEKLLSEGHFVIKTKTRTFVSRKLSNADKKIDNIAIEQKSKGSSEYTVHATIGGETYTGEFDARNPNEIKLGRDVNPTTESEQLETVEGGLKAENVNGYYDVLVKADESMDALIRGDTPENIIANIEAPDYADFVNPVIEELHSKLGSGKYTPEEVQLINELYDNIHKGEQRKNKGNECVTITINF
jgi:hypothetical protein